MTRQNMTLFMVLLSATFLFFAPVSAADKNSVEDVINKVESSMILIPAGEFTMGGTLARNEDPPHKVYLDVYYIGKYEVTFEEYEAFCSDARYNKSVDPRYDYQPPEGMTESRRPVMNVTRNDAEAYCKWLSKKTGKHYRLPTEAEWEKSARGGLERKEYPWGNEAPDAGGIYRTNYGPGFNHFVWKKDGYENTAPVGSYPPNDYGIYDMAGNVWEWVQDWYADDYYCNSPYKNPMGPAEGLRGIIRGGCYASIPEHLRCAKRHAISAGTRSFLIGFRIARDF